MEMDLEQPLNSPSNAPALQHLHSYTGDPSRNFLLFVVPGNIYHQLNRVKDPTSLNNFEQVMLCYI